MSWLHKRGSILKNSYCKPLMVKSVKMMKKVYDFEAIPSGDGECFCFDVDKNTYRRLKKESEMPYFRMSEAWNGALNKGMYGVYMSDLIGYLGQNFNKKIKFKIEISGKNYNPKNEELRRKNGRMGEEKK